MIQDKNIFSIKEAKQPKYIVAVLYSDFPYIIGTF